MRKNFVEILKDAKVDIRNEYSKLHNMFYGKNIVFGEDKRSVYDEISRYFVFFPLRKTCLSIEEFNRKFGFAFLKNPKSFNMDLLIQLSEYMYNLIYCYSQTYLLYAAPFDVQFFFNQILIVIDEIGYMPYFTEGFTIFIEKSPEAISVAEMIPSNEIAYKIFSYNHYSLKGNLQAKREIILVLAQMLESSRKHLKEENSALEHDLFFLFNKLNLRHNNTNPEDKKHYVEYVHKMNLNELENWYDKTYQMCLLAFLTLNHIDRKKEIKQLKEKIEKKESNALVKKL